MKFMTFYDDCCQISSMQRLTNYPLLRKGSCCNAKKMERVRTCNFVVSGLWGEDSNPKFHRMFDLWANSSAALPLSCSKFTTELFWYYKGFSKFLNAGASVRFSWFLVLFSFAEFQTVPSTEVTANKFMSNFLFINPANTRRKRQAVTMIDNVIVMDGSWSVGTDCEFRRGKVAIKNLMKSANAKAVAEGYDEKYAGVTFSTSASENFKFKGYDRAVQELSMIGFPGGMTNTQAGLAKAMNLFLESMTGTQHMLGCGYMPGSQKSF